MDYESSSEQPRADNVFSGLAALIGPISVSLAIQWGSDLVMLSVEGLSAIVAYHSLSVPYRTKTPLALDS